MNNAGKYSKFIVSLLGTVSSGLATFYGSSSWEPVVLGILTTATVLLIPNQEGRKHDPSA